MESLSEYELLRQQNIKRNHAFLEKIGLNQNTTMSSKAEIGKKRKTASSSEIVGEMTIGRRSSRIAALPTMDYKEAIIPTLQRSGNANQDEICDNDNIHDDKCQTPEITSCFTAKSTATTTGTRAINANISVFTDSTALGSHLESFGKLHVVTKANGGVAPKFNKFPGALEWKNCVFLWVNIACKQCSQYDNKFFKYGKEIVWFGGSKMTPESDVIQRLIRAPRSVSDCKKESTESHDAKLPIKSETKIKLESVDKTAEVCLDSHALSEMKEISGVSTLSENTKLATAIANEIVVLFARLEGEPYICLGELALVSCNLQTHPIRFVFELRRFEELVNGPNAKNFARILEASNSSNS